MKKKMEVTKMGVRCRLIVIMQLVEATSAKLVV